MKIYIVLAAILAIALSRERLHAQTNLICNHSFERVNTTTLNKLNNAQVLYSSTFSTENAALSLFDCWLTRGYDPPFQPGWGMAGITYGVMPGLFLRYDGDQYLTFPDFSNRPFVTEHEDAPPRAFIGLSPANTEESGFTLTQNGAGNYGIDMSPPTTYFGANVNAPDGTNYVALVDIENSQWQAAPTIVTDLKFPLVEGTDYTFLMSFCKMNLIGQIKDSEQWNVVKEGKIKVVVCNENLNETQTIGEFDIESNDWTTGSETFIADHNSTRLYVEYNPVKSFPELAQDPKLGGAFIDNLKLYESCSTPEIMCDNANYRRDMLDAQLEEVDVLDGTAYVDPDEPGIPHMRTIRAINLENVRRFEMKIYDDGNQLVRQIDMYYPPSDFVWDGTDDNGNPLPDGNYTALINGLSNDCECYHRTGECGWSDEDMCKHFDLEREYSVFAPTQASYLLDDGNRLIEGLDEVHEMQVKIYSITGQGPLYDFTIINPRPELSFSVESLEALPGNQTIEPAYYRIELTLTNNCRTTTFAFNSHPIVNGFPDGGGQYSEYFDYSPISKPAEFVCPFDINYNQNYLAPMNCCEGDLYIHDVEIWNNWDVQIWGTIYVGPNVVFEPGVTNHFLSDTLIVLIPPDSSTIVFAGYTSMLVGDLYCPYCKVVPAGSLDDDPEGPREQIDLPLEQVLEEDSKEIVLFPNPVGNGQELTLRAGEKPFNAQSYKLTLSNSLGVNVPIKIASASERAIKFKPAAPVPAGSYYLFFETNGEQKTFGVIIR